MMHSTLLDFPDDADIIVENGPPLIPKGKCSYAINPRYFAAKVIRQHGLIFFGRSGWFEWTLDGWLPARPCVIKSRIGDLLLDEVRAYSSSKKSAFSLLKTKAPSTPAYDLVNTRSINEIMQMLAIMCDRGNTLPPLDPDVIPVQNGILRWNTETRDFDFRDYTQDDLIFTKLNASFNPQADQSFFLERLTEIIPDAEDRRVVQEYMGSALFSENRTRKFMLLQGEGGCGKSLLVQLVTNILTIDRTFDLDFRSLNGDYAFSALTTQTMLTASETISGAFCGSTGSEFIKKAVGGDFFQTRQKYRNKKVDHHGFYSLIVVSNNKLRFKYDGLGDEFKDRLLPIHFTHHIDNPDKTLVDTLLREHSSAFLAWLIAGAKQVRQNNWRIELTPTQISRRDRLVEATKGIDLFVNNFIVAAPLQHITSEEAYRAYNHLHHAAGFEYLDRSAFFKRFSKAMVAKFGESDSKNLQGPDGKYNVRGYRDVAFTNSPSSINKQKEVKV